MCGITGICTFNELGRKKMSNLEKATLSLAHRGPDDQGVWDDGTVGLGHRRLSILDVTQNGHQPMQILEGRYTIVFNGEIFNFKSLRKDLIAKGIQFVSDSDTEVILHLYAQEGKAFLKKLNGFFALAIYDNQEQSMFIARDRLGIKPLLYFQDESKVLFASEMQSILTYGIEKEIDHDALNYYLQLNYTPAPLTMIKGVKKLMPGQCIEIVNGKVSIEQYYELPKRESINRSLNYEQAKTQLVDQLDASVQKRMVADVPLGTFLSGGIDSSVITTLAARHTDQLSTFSVGFKDNKFFDETHYAEMVAKKCKTNHTTFKLSNDEIFEEIADIVDHLDEPFADSSAIPVSILCKKTRAHVTVALSGDGADEMFSGYNKHAAWYQMEHGKLKSSLISAAAPLARRMPKSRSGKVSNIMRQVVKFDETKNLSPVERYWRLASLANSSQVNKILVNQSVDTTYQEQWMSGLNDYQDMLEVLRMDTQFVLPNDMLKKVDLMSMANSLEVRVPFLDHELVDFVFSLPEEFKINGKMRKRILQDAFRPVLPAELYNRSKKGFEMPLLDWLRTSLKTELDEHLFNQEVIEGGGLFNWSEISRLNKQLHSSNPGDSHAQVWALYVFQKWYQKHF
ncbi:MAG: asparagine synthase (glutamine-hydrolyzing) [Reichenbachiella sp.]